MNEQQRATRWPICPTSNSSASLADDSAEWRSVSAALVVLRLFDSWMQGGAEVVGEGAPGLRAVRDQIAAMDVRDSNRRLLASIVDSMVTAQAPRIVTVAPRLMAYGRALQHAANWPLAADVYRTVLAYATPVDDAETVIAANMQLGRCLRVLAEWEEALACFAAASQVADNGRRRDEHSARANSGSEHRDRPRKSALRGNAAGRDDSAGEGVGLSEIRATAIHDRALGARRGKPRKRSCRQYEASRAFAIRWPAIAC